MSFTNLLTISMPCYERKEYFLEALESALNQTIKCKIIVVDNCSSHDYFEKICKEKNVTYYRNDRNIGVAANFAKGFELSNTEYVMNLQDDDYLSPEYVESFVKAVNEYPDTDVYFSDFLIISSHGDESHCHTLPFGYIPDGEKIIEYGVKYQLGFPYMSSAIRRRKAHKVVETKGWMGSYDWEWIYSVADHLTFFGDTQKLYHYRIHDNQITNRNHSSFTITLPYIYEMVLKTKVSDPELKKMASKSAFWWLVRLKTESNGAELKELIQGKNKYEKYLGKKLNDSFILKLIYMLPRVFVSFVFKVLIRLGVAS